MKTKFFRNIKLPLLGRGLGGGFLLLWLLGGGCVLFAQNGVTLSGLAVNSGTATFNVSWKNTNMPEAWSDTVWVFVDYNDAGVMKRLPVTGATASAGTVTQIPNNDKGVWVAGNARTQGSFSATVKLFTATANVAGACVYASNYPPVGNYTSATEISFTGTPLYTIVLKDTGGGTITRESGKLFSMPDGYTVQSFTDRTGAPGKLSCMPSTSYNLTASTTVYCAGSSVTFALSNTTLGRTYRLYKDGGAVMNALPGTGGAATFTGAFSGAGVYTAQVIAEGGYCAAVMTGAHTVSENPLPTITHVSTSGAANQSVDQNSEITPIEYTTTHSATISPGSSSFPTGITGDPDGSSYTISGTPAATGTFGYSLTASVNGCTSTVAMGTITVNAVVSTPPVTASTQTWVFGSQTWSDRIVASPAACSLTTMLSTATSPPAQYIVFAGNYYYNWSCVQAAGSANLCPPASEWHVPTDTEMKSLVSNTAESTLISEWGFGGYVINGDELVETTITSRFWTSSPTSATGANALQFGFREYRLQSISARAGLMVRCVKD